MLLFAVTVLGNLHGDTLRIRMIRGIHEEGVTPPVLRDIEAMMRNTLAFKTYALDAEARLPLPANGDLRKLSVYDVTCTGPAERLNVKVVRLGKLILSTVATVRPDNPVILGGFPAREGGMRMFVLTIAPDSK